LPSIPSEAACNRGRSAIPAARNNSHAAPEITTVLREVISAYQKCDAETVQRFGGFVARYMCDGAPAFFGYLEAHEDDAERAVQAGLALVAAVRNLKTHATLQTRVGIATVLAIAGDLIGRGSAQEQTGTIRPSRGVRACGGTC